MLTANDAKQLANEYIVGSNIHDNIKYLLTLISLSAMEGNYHLSLTDTSISDETKSELTALGYRWIFDSGERYGTYYAVLTIRWR
jgi:hypothetical protein